MKKKLKFPVCSVCVNFKKTGYIDERYPIIVRGMCLKYNKEVDNRWEVKCDEFCDAVTCSLCKHYNYGYEMENEYGDLIGYCDVVGEDIRSDMDVCMEFEHE